ncbi:MAG: Trk system potassium transporter TrkA [Bacteroidales bacterium]|nr:Trk system potassium transporter TrkA [Candidatus Latescibacterota bacterium]
MKTVIIGAGNAGKNLVGKLCEMGHDVVVIDKDAGVLDELAQHHDVMTLVGHGADPTILENDIIGNIDLLAAVTNNDEVNFLACCWAKTAGAGHTIARLSDTKFLHSSLVDTEKLGVDRPMVHKGECAKEIFDVLYMPGTLEVTSLLDGKIAAIGLKLPDNTPLIGKSLKEFRADKWFGKVRFIGLVKQGKLTIPDGDSCPEPGDEIYIVLPAGETHQFLDWIRGGRRKAFKKVVIAGGGELGLQLAGLLEETSMETVLIDRHRGRAEDVSQTLKKCLVINADAAEATTLIELGIGSDTAFAAVTGDDEMNIVCCIQAKQLGADFTMARIDRSEYVPILDNLKLVDRVVSPNISLGKAILQYVRGEIVEGVGLFHHIIGEIQEVVIKAGSRRVGATISELKLPPNSIVAAVQRGEQAFVPTGDFMLNQGDRLAIYCLPETAEKINSAF